MTVFVTLRHPSTGGIADIPAEAVEGHLERGWEIAPSDTDEPEAGQPDPSASAAAKTNKPKEPKP